MYVILVSNRGMAGAMDVSWIPDEDNAPLPLSSSYRQSLRRLCELVKSGKKLPPELLSKKKSIDAQCRKLEADDNNISMGDKEGAGLSMLTLTLGAMGLVGLIVGNTNWGQDMIDAARGYWKHIRRNGFFSPGYRSNSNKSRGRRLGDDSASITDSIMQETLTMQHIREARLKALSSGGPNSATGGNEEFVDEG